MTSKMWATASSRERVVIAAASLLVVWHLICLGLSVAGVVDRDLRRWLVLPSYFVIPILALLTIRIYPHQTRGLRAGALGFAVHGVSSLLALVGVSDSSDLWALPSLLGALSINVGMVMMAWDQFGSPAAARRQHGATG